MTEDGNWLVITTTEGTDDRYEITLLDLKTPGARPRKLIAGLENNWSLAGNIGTRFFWTTNKGAPKIKLGSAIHESCLRKSAFIWSISDCWLLMISPHNLRISASVTSAFSHIRMAPA